MSEHRTELDVPSLSVGRAPGLARPGRAPEMLVPLPLARFSQEHTQVLCHGSVRADPVEFASVVQRPSATT